MIIRIHKEAGTKKDAVRIKSMRDIPEFLKGSIDIAHGQLYLMCAEGLETCPLGSVVGYERTDRTHTGWNCWCIGNASTNLVEKDGAFYTKATILEAEPMTMEIPELMRDAAIWCNRDGSWSLEASWGIQTGFPGEAYWVRSGFAEDGTPEGYILTKSEESYRSFIVCDEKGNDVGRLCEIDPI